MSHELATAQRSGGLPGKQFDLVVEVALQFLLQLMGGLSDDPAGEPHLEMQNEYYRTAAY